MTPIERASALWPTSATIASPHHLVRWGTFTFVLGIAAAGNFASAQTPAPPNVEELKQLSIEELAGTEVTTVSRRVERLVDAAAAVTVIRQEDLRRSGVSTLAQALQLADGVHAARVFGPGWAITTRGFNISTANKLLVLIDGRTVYSPVFGGMFWATQDIVLADIDRIEVIHGPGGSIWGANAVNGVINVITKRAADTRGTLVSVDAGTSMFGPVAIRHGGRIGASGSFRVYVKGRTEDGHLLASGIDANDRFTFGQTGFRAESSQQSKNFWTAQGDGYAGTTDLATGLQSSVSGGNLMGRWVRQSGASESRVQAYFDHTYRRVPNQYRGTLNTFDLDTQHHVSTTRHSLVVGAGLRVYDGDDLGDGPGFFFDPRTRVSVRFSAFAQDEMAIAPGRFFLTLGSKLERNEFAGFELQPTARVRFNARSNQTIWAAVSRAVRVPTRFDTDLRIRAPGTDIIVLSGSPDFKSEVLIAYEGGYRIHWKERFAIDVAAYRNRYDDLRSQELPTQPGLPVVLSNQLNALTTGLETSATVQLGPRWQIHAGYSRLWQDFTPDPTSTDRTLGTSEYNDPDQLFTLRSYFNASDRLELDAAFRFADDLPHPFLKSYAELDARAGWRFRPGLEASLIGSDLLHPRHSEFRAGTPLETYERAVSARVTWRF